eukprot:TRINITY_DN1397_c0_g1_i1.p1 TRINITY_DN1397_c0_g1~~TRINITY_DN1397_c0_g1_i1.p1  ORF type:complete len:417 (+),score=53.02 TRINITY_DN1397_c0_g1_i1:58-1308(+)
MDVTVTHTGTGPSCVVDVSENENVAQLKEHALDKMFAGDYMNTSREAAVVSARIEGCEELDDAQLVADTGLEAGGTVVLIRRRWPQLNAPAVYSSAHGDGVLTIAVSRCGELCAVGYEHGHVTVFDTITGDTVADFTHGVSIPSVAFSVCGKWLAAASAVDGTICVWCTATWGEMCLLDDDDVVSLVWTYCGRLVSGGSGEVRVWDFIAAPTFRALEGQMGLCCVAVSRTRLFSCSTECTTLYVWDIGTLEQTHTLHHNRAPAESYVGISAVDVTDDDQYLVTCSHDLMLAVWCGRNLTCLRTVQLHDHPVDLALSQESDVIAVQHDDCITLLCLSTSECRCQLQGVPCNQRKVQSSICAHVALSSCGKWVFATQKASVSVCAVSGSTECRTPLNAPLPQNEPFSFWRLLVSEKSH